MGSSLSRWIYGKTEVRIVILGLRESGKTKMLYKLQLGEIKTVIPMIGFHMEEVKRKGIQIWSWTLGGRMGLRPLLRHYYKEIDGLVFVLDSCDQANLSALKFWIQDCTEDVMNKNVPLLIMANKQDRPAAYPPEIIADKLCLTDMLDRPWKIYPCSSVSGAGIQEGMEWLMTMIAANIVKSDLRKSLKAFVKDLTPKSISAQ